jgi:hypothetical protein
LKTIVALRQVSLVRVARGFNEVYAPLIDPFLCLSHWIEFLQHMATRM